MCMPRWMVWMVGCLLALPGQAEPGQAQPVTFEPPAYQALTYRLIGPYRGGRVTAVAGIPDQPFTFFMGATGGGVWKTQDAGQTWHPVADGQITVGSIGAITVAPSDANVVYVGTGSACPRGNVSHGNGLYRSDDGGQTWRHIGLDEAGLIGRIHVHPQNPDLVYAAVLGNIFGPSATRGVYRSTDGGASWERVLFVSDSTGAVDLAMDPTNPRILYAGMWRAERKPWTLIDGGTEGGVWKSTDGGDTWTKLGGGLPEGLVGRVGVAVSPAQPGRVWVLQEHAEKGQGGVFRSDDGGRTWQHVSKDRKLLQRAWYYSHIYADPQDPNTVYAQNTSLYKSVDAGVTWERIPTPHGDDHALWINPHNPQILIEGNDGGVNVSLNGGATWSTQFNQPTAEFYRVTVDTQFPYRVYGAQQDNTTISVPSHPTGGITPEQHWYAVGGGESGHIAVDPRNPDLVYAGNYIGQITRLDRRQGRGRNIVAYPQMHDGVAPRDIRYRFQWNAPIRLSPHNPDVLYHASQYVHRSTDGGQTWEIISPDLTTNNDAYHDIPGGPIQHDHTGVELYTTIFALEESPHTPGELWAGSDDGLVHLTRDNGRTWQPITPRQMPEGGTVNTIELSPHRPGKAYLAVYRYRENDFRPYVFRTTDYGASWTVLTDGTNGIPADHFVRVVREDPDREGLLYAGTEFGMYVSFDDGETWQPFQQNLPHTPITDLKVYRGDLVVATQGRSFWILDDLSPLHQLTPAILQAEAHLFAPRPAYRTQLGSFRAGAAPEAPPKGAILYVHLREQPTERVTVEIRDPAGRTAAVFSNQPAEDSDERKLELKAGLNRFNWDLTYAPPDLVEGAIMSLAYTGGPSAPPGTYTVRLTVGDVVQEQPLVVAKDPRWDVPDADLQAQFELTQAILAKLNETHDAVENIRAVREQVRTIARRAVRAGYDSTLVAAADDLAAKLTAIEADLIQAKHEAGQDPINFPPRLDDQFAYLYTVVNFQDARPTAGAYERFRDLEAELDEHLARLAGVMQDDLAAFNQRLSGAEVPRIIVPVPGVGTGGASDDR
ncbi:MAG: glycosyl hydrolase [Bacteroidetes bacterium]|nr:MAG: glycosyl hydrolase [Bacteroidota bacterium]